MAGAALREAPASDPPVDAPVPVAAHRPPVAALVAGLAGLVALALYVRTAAPGVQGGDSGELQFVAYILGIPHPPGYPLYALVGKLWTLVFPFGEVAWRMNLLSALFAALAVGATASAAATTARRERSGGSAGGRAGGGAVVSAVNVLRGRGSAAAGVAAGLVAAAWLALAPTWWSQATIASVRAPTGFFLAAVLAALALYARDRRPWQLYAAAALYGLGLTHHLSIASLGPALALFGLLLRPPLAAIARAVVAFLIPLAVYAYLPIRSAMGTPFDASHPTTVRAFLDLATAQGFAGDMWFYDPLSPERLELGRQILLTNFGALGLMLALLGALATLATRPRWFVLTVGIAAINLYVGLAYRAPVIADYLIPTYVVLALWIGQLGGVMARPMRQAGLLALVLALPPIAYGAGAWSAFDLSGDTADERFLSGAFAEAAPGATILTDWYHATILWYGQYARGERPDVTVDYVGPEGGDVPWLRKAEVALGRGPVYATALDPRLAERHHLQRAGELYQVQGGPSRDVPAGATAAGIRYGDAIELAAFRVEPPLDDADAAVTLYWRALAPIATDYREFVHLADATGHVWGQRDGTPGEGVYATTRWRDGEVIAEQYDFATGAPAGQYRLLVGLYETVPGGWKRLEARGPDDASLGDAPEITHVAVAPPPVPPDTRVDATDLVSRGLHRIERVLRGDGPRRGVPVWARRDGQLWVPLGHRAVLEGWALDREDAAPGDELRVALDFLPVSRFPEDAAAFVHLVDANGAMRAQSDGVPVVGGLPTLRWAPWRPVRDTRVLRLPSDLPPGTYRLEAGLYVMATGAHLPVLDDRLAQAGQGDHVVLSELVVRR